jgi:hypothetical protein
MLSLSVQAVTETHLLQFGAMLGEASSRTQLQQQEAGGPMGHPSSFYGSPDTDAFQGPWELVVQEQQPGSVRYWAWRRPLRKGLFMYMTRTVFLSASPAEVRHFMLDDAYRKQWDGSMQELRHVSSSSGSSSREGCGESGMMYSRVSFPKPMAARSYLYARRVWPRPCDGGCYSLARSSSHPDAPKVSGRGVTVQDFVSGCVVRRPAPDLLPRRYSGPAAEVLLVYFEDSQVRPGLANLGIKKGLWPLVQRTERALRTYQQASGGVQAAVAAAAAARVGCGGHGDSDVRGAGCTEKAMVKGSSSSRGVVSIAADAVRGLVGGLLLPASLLKQGWKQGWGLLVKWQAKVAMLLPSLEWKLLRWLMGSCAAPAHLLTTQHNSSGTPGAGGSTSSSSKGSGFGSWFARSRLGLGGGSSAGGCDGCRRVVSESGGVRSVVGLHRVSSHPLSEQELHQLGVSAPTAVAVRGPSGSGRVAKGRAGSGSGHATRLQQLQQEDASCWGAVAAAAMGPGVLCLPGEKQQEELQRVTQGSLELHRVPSHALTEDDINGATVEEELLALMGEGGSKPLLDLCDDELQEEGEEQWEGTSAYLTPALLARLPSGCEDLLGEGWPRGAHTTSSSSAAAAAGGRSKGRRGGGFSYSTSSCGGGSMRGAGGVCHCNSCFGIAGGSVGYSTTSSSTEVRLAPAAVAGGGCSYCGSSSVSSSSRTSSSCGSNGGGGRGQRGSRRRRLMVRLIQAAGVRLVHHLLVGNEGGQGDR